MSDNSPAVSLNFYSDGNVTQLVWEVCDEDAASTLKERLCGLLGEPDAEVLLDRLVVSAAAKDLVESGATVVMLSGDAQ